jgi:hypothetical protein
VEFAFDCWAANGDIFRHSYGIGGFAEHEDFDTDVQCAQCHPPSEDAVQKTAVPALAKVAETSQTVSFAKTKAAHSPAQHPLAPMLAPSARAAAAIAGTEDQKAGTRHSLPRVAGGMGDLATKREIRVEPVVSRYGPKQCVSTWRSTEGHCILQTACQDVEISSYEIGLICIDPRGGKTRHVFGRGSFDSSETFDTLAECSQCIGLDDQRAVAFKVQRRRWKQSEEANEVATLSEQVHTLTQGMTSMLSAVLKMRQKVENEQKSTPSPSVVATLAAWTGELTAASSEVKDITSAASSSDGGSTPRLRNTATATSPRMPVVAQVEEVKTKHHHRRHHRRRIVEDEDEDQDEDDDVSDTRRDTDDGEGEKVQSDEDEGPELTEDTNGVGEPLSLSESSDAEASELDLAADGEASAGALDDGSMSLEPAW